MLGTGDKTAIKHTPFLLLCSSPHLVPLPNLLKHVCYYYLKYLIVLKLCVSVPYQIVSP